MKTFDERRKSVNEYVSKIKAKRRKTAIMATGICLAVAILSAVLFIPYSTTPPSVLRYSRSQYYTVIQRLNEVTYQKPKYKNNFQALCAFLTNNVKRHYVTGGYWVIEGDATPPTGVIDGIESPQPQAPGAPSYGESTDGAVDNGSYEETTDNQVEGVIEADLMKRSDKYIYYLRKNQLSIYSIKGMDSHLVGQNSISAFHTADAYESLQISYLGSTEMYLSQDCNTVILVQNGYGKGVSKCTALVTLDVSDPANIRHKDTVYFVGDYVSSRMVDGSILLAYNYHVNKSKIDFSDPATFVPRYGRLENMQCIPAENIVCPEDVTATRYTVICKVNGDTLEVEGSAALLSYSQELYVSADTVYATHGYTHKNSEVFNSEYKQTAMTEITGVSYAGDGLEILGTVTLEGSVKNQYSMDQYDGILRVVTSTAVTEIREAIMGERTTITRDVTQRNVNLYCVDLADWQVEASVIGFAPAGEEATSVRFDGKNAYVCTAEVITFSDPVYFFDLSDLENITYTDTGIIDGYSTSLIQLGDGYLMGIGYGENRRLKIEIYEKAENSVEPVCTYEPGALFSEVYKSYFIDREKNLVGLAIKEWDSEEGKYVSQYVLLHFDGYQLNVVKTMDCEGNLGSVRAALIDGYFYVFSDLFRVESLT